MLNCNFKGRSFEDIVQHLKKDKSLRVSKEALSDEMKVETSRQHNSYCELCYIRCTSEFSLQEHKNGKKHRMNEFRALYRQNR